MNNKNIVWFKNISKSDTNSVGEKAAYLSELYNQKLPVPNGFVISQKFFNSIISDYHDIIDDLFTKSTDFNNAINASNQIKNIIKKFTFTEELKTLLLKNYRELEEAERYKGIPEKTLNLISPTRDLPFVAVRISTDKAFPSLFKPSLNAYGIESLMDAIKSVLINVFSPRAILYYNKHNITLANLNVSIIIQKMSSSNKSGDMFSINPIKNSKDEIYVQSMWGIKNGYLNKPSIFIFNKSTNSLTEEHLYDQETYITKNAQFGELIAEPVPENMRHAAVLSKAELMALCDIAKKIEQIMNFPQHIEWTIGRKGVQIVQTQPITRILNKPLTTKPSTESNVISQGIPLVAKSASGRIIQDIQNTDVSDNIILADELNNNMLPALIKSGGFVTSTLGLTSNAAFMCKEFDIPCIVGATNITRAVRDNQKVEFNSDGSITSIIEQVAPVENYSSYSNNPQQQYSESETQSNELSNTSSVSGGFDELYQHFMRLERYITELVSHEAQKRASGENTTEEDARRAQKLSELEWQIRALRKKINED